jgi:hypothetical protein
MTFLFVFHISLLTFVITQKIHFISALLLTCWLNNLMDNNTIIYSFIQNWYFLKFRNVKFQKRFFFIYFPDKCYIYLNYSQSPRALFFQIVYSRKYIYFVLEFICISFPCIWLCSHFRQNNNFPLILHISRTIIWIIYGLYSTPDAQWFCFSIRVKNQVWHT